MSDKPTIIMVHGAFCGGWTFDQFRKPFEAEGYAVLAPNLRGHGSRDKRSMVTGVSMRDYASDISDLVAKQTRPPILLGHSMGGLVAQMAAARAPVHALILLAPSAPWGVAGGSVEEAISAVSLYALGPFWAQPIEPDLTAASTYSLNRLSKEDRQSVFKRMRRESGRALWETLNWWLDPFMTTSVGRIKAPSLALVGERDLIHPPSTVNQTARKIGAVTQVFPEMSHWLPGEPGWEAVAEACIDWLDTEDVRTAA